MKKTIFALSTPESVSAIAVIRISGPDTLNALGLLCRCNVTSFKKKRTLTLRKIYSSILLPVSMRAVAIIVSEPPSSIFLAAPKNLFGLWRAFASTPPVRTFPEEGTTVL